MFHQNFLSPQVKRCAIITYKHGINEKIYELPNNLIPALFSPLAGPMCPHKKKDLQSKEISKYWESV